MAINRNANEEVYTAYEVIFTKAIRLAFQAFNEQAFRPDRPLNAAVFDAVMVALARRVQQAPRPDPIKVREAYEQLLENQNFQDAYRKATSDEESVRTRIKLATKAFMGC